MNTLYPIFLNIEHRPVLVVGGGTAAVQKITSVLQAKAEVTVIAPQVSAAIEEYAGEKRITLYRREYAAGDVRGFFIVIGATDNRDVQQMIFTDAQSEHIPVNIVDVPRLCTFFLSSVFQKGDLTIAVSTNGKSPTMGKIVRDRIRAEFSEGYPELLEIIGGMRPEVLKAFPDFERRKNLFEQLVRRELERLPLYARRTTHQCGESISSKGKVYLIGAGPGDPELITVKGLKILQTADVILYDALVGTQLLAYAPRNAERIYVGKRDHRHCRTQGDINSLLVSKASEGKCVVRLKGGDPFIFGRGGEELEALREAGVDVEVVPGITAGTGIPTSLGIPLTHRGTASSVVFVTGHEDPAKNNGRIDWQSVSHIDTIVIYMGANRLSSIVQRLRQHGMPSRKPVAIIYGGTLNGESVVRGVLGDIEELARNRPSESPGLVIVGDVVRFLDRRPERETHIDAVESISMEYSR